MIKIIFNEPATVEWHEWREKCEVKSHELIDWVMQGNNSAEKITDLYKEKTIKKKYYINAKEPPFWGKCAYCETHVDQYGDIDHYRPARAVTDQNDQPVLIGGLNHPGYYWLAYDCTNLLPSCEECNRPSKLGEKKIGKHCRFPVRHMRAVAPGEEINEEPLLINPIIDNPEDHFNINVETGILGPRTDRGKTCIDILGLNERDPLRDARKTAYRSAQALLVQYLYSNDETAMKKCIEELCEIIVGKTPHSIAGREAIKKIPGLYDHLEDHLECIDCNAAVDT